MDPILGVTFCSVESVLGCDALSDNSRKRLHVDRLQTFTFPLRVPSLRPAPKGFLMVSMRVRDRESIQEAVRRFRKLVERSGLKREMRRRQYYEKPSETKRRDRLRAQRRAANAKRMSTRK